MRRPTDRLRSRLVTTEPGRESLVAQLALQYSSLNHCATREALMTKFDDKICPQKMAAPPFCLSEHSPCESKNVITKQTKLFVPLKICCMLNIMCYSLENKCDSG